ncbi:MAG: hypothetical protein EOO88_63380 [Pedobacter sp.]|nr:MAG: hypothetical protein EOO88_63380 [Pedobacter sp.]
MRKVLIALIFLGIPFTKVLAQDSRVTLNLNQQSLKTLFDQIAKQSGYVFVYSDEIVQDSMKVSIKVKKTPIRTVLDNVFSGKNIVYKMVTDKLIAVGYQGTGKHPEVFTALSDSAFLGNSMMSETVQTLQTVNIKGNKPLIERKTDRYIINVENGALAQGLSAFEVLQKSPGIWVSQNGNIRIKGNQSVMVMINDVVQRMSQDDLAEYLKSLRSEDISKIEVIYNPPAEFEASGTGGIVHIVLKKSRKDGRKTTSYGEEEKDLGLPVLEGWPLGSTVFA